MEYGKRKMLQSPPSRETTAVTMKSIREILAEGGAEDMLMTSSKPAPSDRQPDSQRRAETQTQAPPTARRPVHGEQQTVRSGQQAPRQTHSSQMPGRPAQPQTPLRRPAQPGLQMPPHMQPRQSLSDQPKTTIGDLIHDSAPDIAPSRTPTSRRAEVRPHAAPEKPRGLVGRLLGRG